MSILDRIASRQNRRDDIPNQELARELVEFNNLAGVKEIAENLHCKGKNIQSDCIKVLYEVGYLKPEMIADYASDFTSLLKSKNNRLVWGSMIALSTVASLKADMIYENLDRIYTAMNQGSVITKDNGIKVLATIASQNKQYEKAIFPYLLDHLKTCRPKEVCQHAESTFVAVYNQNKDNFIQILKQRESNLTSSQLTRLKKLYKAIDNCTNGCQ